MDTLIEWQLVDHGWLPVTVDAGAALSGPDAPRGTPTGCVSGGVVVVSGPDRWTGSCVRQEGATHRVARIGSG